MYLLKTNVFTLIFASLLISGPSIAMDEKETPEKYEQRTGRKKETPEEYRQRTGRKKETPEEFRQRHERVEQKKQARKNEASEEWSYESYLEKKKQDESNLEIDYNLALMEHMSKRSNLNDCFPDYEEYVKNRSSTTRSSTTMKKETPEEYEQRHERIKQEKLEHKKNKETPEEYRQRQEENKKKAEKYKKNQEEHRQGISFGRPKTSPNRYFEMGRDSILNPNQKASSWMMPTNYKDKLAYRNGRETEKPYVWDGEVK